MCVAAWAFALRLRGVASGSASNGTALTAAPGRDFLHALDDHAVALGKARGDEPLVAQGAIGRELALLDFPFGVHDQRDRDCPWDRARRPAGERESPAR